MVEGAEEEDECAGGEDDEDELEDEDREPVGEGTDALPDRAVGDHHGFEAHDMLGSAFGRRRRHLRSSTCMSIDAMGEEEEKGW